MLLDKKQLNGLVSKNKYDISIIKFIDNKFVLYKRYTVHNTSGYIYLIPKNNKYKVFTKNNKKVYDNNIIESLLKIFNKQRLDPNIIGYQIGKYIPRKIRLLNKTFYSKATQMYLKYNFVNLDKLTLEDVKRVGINIYKIKNYDNQYDLKYFPNLCELKISDGTFKLGQYHNSHHIYRNLAKMVPKLKKLYMAETFDNIITLPSTLEELYIGTHFNTPIKLPKTLKIFSLVSDLDDEYEFDQPLELHEGLIKLWYTGSYKLEFPQSLKELCLLNNFYTHDIPLLPNLTTLYVHDAFVGKCHLTNQITRLTVNKWMHITILPKKLDILYIYNQPNIILNNIQKVGKIRIIEDI